MGRILLVHKNPGVRELLTRGVGDLHQVDAVDGERPALERINAGILYDFVLCDAADPEAARRAFEAACQHSRPRLILIAADHQQYAGVIEAWSTNGAPRAAASTPEFLTQRSTAAEILRLFSGSPFKAAIAENKSGTSGSEPREAAPPKTGDTIDGYLLEAVIGSGGFGTTWLAVNQTSGKRVAIKCVEGAEQLLQERAALQKYVHVAERDGHLIRVDHANRVGPRLCLVMPLADSITGVDAPGAYKALTLARRLEASGHLDQLEACRIVLGLLQGLATLHAAGLLHGDVSPTNVFSIRQRWQLGDPGLVRFIGEPGICRNRTYYPHPLASWPADDLYAAGRLIWEMVSGISSLKTDSDRNRLAPDGQLLTFISRKKHPLAPVLNRALAERDPNRYSVASEMAKDLEQALAHLSGSGAGEPPLYGLLAPLRGS